MATYPSRYDAVSHGGHRPLQPQHHQQQHQQQQSTTHQLAKTTTAVTLGGSLMVLSGVTLAGTVIGLVLLTPLLVIFSPVLIPAAFTLFLVTAGLVTSGGLGATASFVFYWMYKYATGKHPIGADKLDYARDQLTHAARDVKDKAEYYGHQTAQQIKGSPERDT